MREMVGDVAIIVAKVVGAGLGILMFAAVLAALTVFCGALLHLGWNMVHT